MNIKREYNLEDVNYDIVECPNNRFWEEAKDKLEEVLTIKDGNTILLCHPRHIFDVESEDFTIKIIEKFDWNKLILKR